MMGVAILLSLLVTAQAAPAKPATPDADWRTVATQRDRERLRGWRASFVAALQRARSSGHTREVRGDPALFNPDRALPDATPPEGAYRCRTIKLGAKTGGVLDYVAYPAFDCRVSAGPVPGTLNFARLDGSQRPVGVLYPDATRAVFLGSLLLGDEQRPIPYGVDEARNMAGYVERIADRRWRLVLPSPAFESLTDLIELVPA